MKKLILFSASLFCCILLQAQTNIFPSTGAAGIGTTTPDPSSLLDINSTSKGILIPRMTEAQRNAMVSPPEGLLIYQINHSPGFYYNEGPGWKAVSGWSLHGNSSINPSKEFIGTIDGEPLIFKVNNEKSGIIDWVQFSENTSFGYQTLNSNKGGTYNSAFGYQSLFSNTSGEANTANGANTLYFNTTGYGNTAIGFRALYSNTAGSNNTANGTDALLFNTTGGQNTANGYGALYWNTTGYNNEAFGFQSLYGNTTGVTNSAFGDASLYENTTGYDNLACGSFSLYFNSTGAENTAIGSFSGVTVGNYQNSSCLGCQSNMTASNQVRIGNSNVTSIGGYTNWTNISDARVKKNIKQNVPGLAFINLLKPVTYNYDLVAADKIVWPNGRPVIKDHPQPEALLQLDAQAKQEKEQIIYTGFLAQDVETAAKSIGYDFSGVDAPKNDKDLYGLRYAEFVVPLVKAVQELDSSQKQEAKSQNDEIDSLKSEIENLKLIVSNLESTMSGDSKFLQMDSPGKTSNYTLQTANLYQNVPNPFNQQTIIRFNLPSQFSSAQITISNSAGAVLRNFNLSNEMNQIVLQASEFPAGNYEYSLLIDGKVVDSKQMVLTK